MDTQMHNKEIGTLKWPYVVYSLSLVALFGLTVGLFEFFPRFEVSGLPILNVEIFDRNLDGWSIYGPREVASIKTGAATLEDQDTSRSVGLYRYLPLTGGQDTLLMSVDVSTEDVRRGQKSWHTALVYLVGRDSDGQLLWKTQRVAAQLEGTNPWRRYSTSFTFDENIKEAMFGAFLAHTTGTLKIRNLVITPVKERAPFLYLAYALIAAWALMITRIGYVSLRSVASPMFGWGIAAVAIVIAVGVLLPGSLKHEVQATVFSFAAQPLLDFVWGEPEFFGITSSQAGHFIIFLILGVIGRLAWSHTSPWIILIGLLIFAAVTETLQLYVPNRYPSVEDWFTDATGVITGLILCGIVFKKRLSFYDHQQLERGERPLVRTGSRPDEDRSG